MPETAEEKAKREAQEAADAALEERIVRIVNSALTSHAKREAKATEKALADMVAKALETAKPAEKPADETAEKPEKPSAKVTPEQRLANERLERLERQLAEEKAAREQVETRARQERARGDMRSALEAKGIRGAKAAALISHFEASGALKFDENGTPRLSVARVRVKGGEPEAQDWDIARGVEDWAKTEDARDFLPAPASMSQPGRGAVARPPSQGAGTAPRYDKPAVSEDEAARRAVESLRAQGVDVTEAFRR